MKLQPLYSNRSVLNYVLNLQRHSLANYLRFAKPWTQQGHCRLSTAVIDIAAVQLQNAIRVGELIVERYGNTDFSVFSTHYAKFNDLSIDFAAACVLDDLERIIRRLQFCGDLLIDDCAAREMVQQIRCDEERNLCMLRNELHRPRNIDVAFQSPLLRVTHNVAPDPENCTTAA